MVGKYEIYAAYLPSGQKMMEETFDILPFVWVYSNLLVKIYFCFSLL